MASFGKKKKITQYLYTWPVIAVLCVITAFMAYAVYVRFTIEREMASRRAEVERQRQELIDRKEVLKEKVEYFSGERGIEEEIRTHFDVAKEGERVVIIVDKEDEESEPETLMETVKPWYQFW